MLTNQANAHQEITFEAMGTQVHVIVMGLVTSGRDDLSLALDSARLMIERSEDRWSRFRPSSELSQINAAAGRPIRVSDETFQLLSTALLAHETTNGAFDPSLGAPLIAAGYDRSFIDLENGARRDDGQADRPARIGLDELLVEPITQTITVPVGMQLDLGGIAKGATADAVADRLIRDGMAGCCVSIGGDLRVRGVGPEDGRWRVDLDCPGSDQTRSVLLSDGGVCTSSISKRTWLPDGANSPAHHLIDPDTHEPRASGPASVTVIAATATAAEVLTKWVMAGGQPSEFEATGLVVARNGSVRTFPGFDRYQADVITG